jgi:hypothetical protein
MQSSPRAQSLGLAQTVRQLVAPQANGVHSF